MYNIYIQYNYVCIGYMLCRLTYCVPHVQDLDSWPHMHACQQPDICCTNMHSIGTCYSD